MRIVRPAGTGAPPFGVRRTATGPGAPGRS